MFTGIVEEVGNVIGIEKREAGALLSIECRQVLRDASVGSSISVNGACLTVVEMTESGFTSDLAPETLERTNLGDLERGSRVNLERPVRANGRLDGHFVLGHIDGTARLSGLDDLGDQNWWLEIEVPSNLVRYIVPKGSVALDGMSLTVAGIEKETVSFTIIPHTYAQTSLHTLKAGMRMNVEVDILAKHLEKLMQQGLSG